MASAYVIVIDRDGEALNLSDLCEDFAGGHFTPAEVADLLGQETCEYVLDTIDGCRRFGYSAGYIAARLYLEVCDQDGEPLD